MKVQRISHRASFVVAMVIAVLAATPMTSIARASSPGILTADLDGKMIDLTTVGTLHCHDFDYPRIHCFRTADALATAVAPTLAAASIAYVAVESRDGDVQPEPEPKGGPVTGLVGRPEWLPWSLWSLSPLAPSMASSSTRRTSSTSPVLL
jgi:hypothetical protein